MSKQLAVEVEVNNSCRGRSWRLLLEKFSIIVSRLGRNLWKREQLFPRSAPGSNFKRGCRTWAVDYSLKDWCLERWQDPMEQLPLCLVAAVDLA